MVVWHRFRLATRRRMTIERTTVKLSINKTELQNALSVVLKGASSRSTLSILSGVLLEAADDTLTLQTTDLELSIQYAVPALVEEEGRAVLPAKLFSDMVKNLSDAAVHLSADEETADIACDGASINVKALNPDDFPGFPHVDVTQRIEVPFAQFSTMVRRVARFVSRDASRAILTGVLVTLEGGVLKMVATDSYRLAITEANVPGSTAEDFQAVISGSFLQEIAALPKSDEPVSLALAENQIVVTYRQTVFVNRRIEGNFPNYKQLLPNGHALRATVDVDRLTAAVKRVSIIGQTPSSGASPVQLDVNVASQTLQLSAAAQDVGSAQETIPCTAEGEDARIAFNYSYVLEGLSAVETDQVNFDVQSSMNPGIFTAVGDENYLYLVMPVRIPS